MTFHDFAVTDAKGKKVSLSEFKGQVVLVVNVASQCGLTPQYEGLQALHDRFYERGLKIIGFPCNQFAGQEPGDNEEIQNFCETRFNVKFPVMAKVDVNGPNADPLYKYLKGEAPGLLGTEVIKWNFTKFLIGRDGKVLKRFAPTTKPENLAADIEAAL